MDEMQESRGRSLLRHLAAVPDRRHARGRRHPLSAILALSVAAMLSGARSLYAIAQWGRLQKPDVVRSLGFTRQATPAVSTLHEVFKLLDIEAFEAAMSAWAREELGEVKGGIAIDGKGLKGIHGEELPGVRLVAAYSDEAGLVLAQKGGQGREGGGANQGS